MSGRRCEDFIFRCKSTVPSPKFSLWIKDTGGEGSRGGLIVVEGFENALRRLLFITTGECIGHIRLATTVQYGGSVNITISFVCDPSFANHSCWSPVPHPGILHSPWKVAHTPRLFLWERICQDQHHSCAVCQLQGAGSLPLDGGPCSLRQK